MLTESALTVQPTHNLAVDQRSSQPGRLGTRLPQSVLLVLFGFNNLAATVKTARANVVAQVGFTSCRLNCRWRIGQRRVGVVHTALGR